MNTEEWPHSWNQTFSRVCSHMNNTGGSPLRCIQNHAEISGAFRPETNSPHFCRSLPREWHRFFILRYLYCSLFHIFVSVSVRKVIDTPTRSWWLIQRISCCGLICTLSRVFTRRLAGEPPLTLTCVFSQTAPLRRMSRDSPKFSVCLKAADATFHSSSQMDGGDQECCQHHGSDEPAHT